MVDAVEEKVHGNAYTVIGKIAGRASVCMG